MIPVKKDTQNIFDFDMKKYFYIDIVVSDGNDCCLFTINRFTKLEDAEKEYSELIDTINSESIENLLKNFIKIVK